MNGFLNFALIVKTLAMMSLAAVGCTQGRKSRFLRRLLSRESPKFNLRSKIGCL